MPLPKELLYLIEGYKEFKERYFDQRLSPYRILVQGQAPKIMTIACSDSRVDPAILLNTQPGEMFVVRNVANLVPPYEADQTHHGVSAALEFGITRLGVKHVIILGHSHCGGIASLFATDNTHTDFIKPWMALVEPAKKHILENHTHDGTENQIDLCSQKALTISLKNLQTFPWIQSRLETGDLRIHGWYFDLEHGLLKAYDEDSETFEEFKV